MPRYSKVLVVVLVVGGLTACGWFLFRGPSVSVNLVSARIDDLKIRVRTYGVNGILGLSVWSETKNEFLWACYVGYLPHEPIAYGKAPQRGEQTFPKDGSAPRRIQPGERFVVEVSYQYDTFMAASGGETFFVFEADSAGNAGLIRESAFVPGPPMP